MNTMMVRAEMTGEAPSLVGVWVGVGVVGVVVVVVVVVVVFP